jgi:hypothetical protein
MNTPNEDQQGAVETSAPTDLQGAARSTGPDHGHDGAGAWSPPPLLKPGIGNAPTGWTPPPVGQENKRGRTTITITRRDAAIAVVVVMLLGVFGVVYVVINREIPEPGVMQTEPVSPGWQQNEALPPAVVSSQPGEDQRRPAPLEPPTAASGQDSRPQGTENPGGFLCPEGIYHISLEEHVRLGEASNFLTIKRGEDVIYNEHFLGGLKKVLWSEGTRYVAIEEEQESPGDSVWIIDLQSGSGVKGPYGEQSDRMMSESAAMMMRVASSKWGAEVVAEGGEVLTLGWHAPATLLVRFNHFYLPPPDFDKFEILGQTARLHIEGDSFRMEWPNAESGLPEQIERRKAGDNQEPPLATWTEIRSPRLHVNQLFSVDRGNNSVSFGIFWMERFGAAQFVAHVNDVDWSKSRFDKVVDDGDFAAAARISIPMREGKTHEVSIWSSDAGYSSEAPPWKEKVPPIIRRQSREAITLFAVDRKSADSLVALFRKFPELPESEKDKLSLDPATSLPGERYPQTRMGLIREEDFSHLGKDDLRYAINEIFARHGGFFGNNEVLAMFEGFNWYRPLITMTLDDIEKGSFTEHEKQNLKILGTLRERAP